MLKPEVVVWTLPSEAVMTPTRGTVVIADWEALPVAEALSPEAEPPAPVEMALRAGFKIVRAAEGEAVAPEERVDSTPGLKVSESRLALARGKGTYPGTGSERNR